MARIRTIKPEFFTNEGLSALQPSTHLLAAALLCYADDEGCFNANPQLIRAACCPLREPTVAISESLKSLTEIGYLELSTGIDGREYGRISKFAQHQSINRAKPSKITALVTAWIVPGAIRDDSMLEGEQGTGNREQGNESCCAASAEIARNGPSSTASEFTFPTVGKGGDQWTLPKAKLAEYLESYPGVDVVTELRKARQWCRDNPRGRKTSAGMASFLSRWLSKVQNAVGRPSGSALKPQLSDLV